MGCIFVKDPGRFTLQDNSQFTMLQVSFQFFSFSLNKYVAQWESPLFLSLVPPPPTLPTHFLDLESKSTPTLIIPNPLQLMTAAVPLIRLLIFQPPPPPK